MLTINDTALNDNQFIFIVRVTLQDGTVLRFGTREITLSSNLYRGNVIGKNSLNEVAKTVNIFNGGGIGSLNGWEFLIANSGVYFFDDFYPTTSAPVLRTATVEVGGLWEGATTEGEITWFFYGYVDEYSYTRRGISVTALEYQQIDDVKLPYYKVQGDLDNGMSYFPNAPEDAFGRVIPLAYGTLSTATGNQKYYNWTLGYAIQIHKYLPAFKVASHECYNVPTDPDLYQYLDGVDTYFRAQGEDGVVTNDNTGFSIALMGPSRAADKRILGRLYLRCNVVGGISQVNDVSAALDKDDTNYITLANATTTIAAFKIDADLTQGQLGTLSRSLASDIAIIITWSSDSANSRSLKINYYHPNLSSPGYATGTTKTNSGTTATEDQYDIGSNTTTRIEAVLPWTVEELLGIEYVAENVTTFTSGENLRIYNAYLLLDNFIVNQLYRKSDVAPLDTRGDI